MRSRAEVDEVLALHARGLKNCEIARRTGIPRGTVVAWVNGREPRGAYRRGGICPICDPDQVVFPTLSAFAYAYLLGLYLGDGCLLRHPRGVFRLNIALDSKYPLIIEEATAATSVVMAASRVSATPHAQYNMVNVNAYSKHWPCVFPQHGPGMKHARLIQLQLWQERIVEKYPGRLLRGLIHSDGCRVQNLIRHPKKTYSYPRYFFSNRSGDIQGIFCNACDLLGIEWRQDGPWNISVARRGSVAILDEHVGPKR
jgi:hypothetical protein